MELVYLWVEEYKNIRNQGFNFSPRFDCKYDGENLSIEETGNDVSIFPENINITAIVGENGSGKSSICKSIFDFDENKKLTNKKIRISNDIYSSSLNETLKVTIFLLYFDKNNKEYLYYTNNDFLCLKLNNEELSVDKRKDIRNLNTFYLNNSKNILLSINNNLPNIPLLEQLLQLLLKNENFYTFYNKEYIFTKMIIRLNRDKLDDDLDNLEYKDFLINLREKISTIILKELEPKNFTPPLKEKKKTHYIETSSSKNFIIDLKLAFLSSFFNNLVSLFSNSENLKKTFLNKNNNFFNDLTIDNMINKFIDFNKGINYHNLHYQQNDEVLRIFENLLNFFSENDINNFIKFIQKENILEKEYFLLKFDIKENSKLLINLLKLIDKLTNYNENNLINLFQLDIENFDGTIKYEELSDGEKAIFEVFSKILYRIIFMNEKTLFLDEPETFLHPNWSKEIINLLIKLIEHLKLKDLNIIITSHSPFILSDLPKKNVIFLDKVDEDTKEKYPSLDISNLEKGNCIDVSKYIDINPFGANIHTLLSHGFFMKDGLMGEFAKEKIQSIIKCHNKLLRGKLDKKEKTQLKNKYEKDKKEQFKQIQKIIGDDYLKQVIKNHIIEIEKILYDDFMLDEEIKHLETKLNKLKELKNNA